MSMSNQDRETLDTLFSRLADAERRAAPRDAEADALIRDHIARQPGAPYFMAQTIVMQDYALKEAQRRIADLESRDAGREQPGNLFPSGFGAQQAAPAAAPAPAQSGPWSQPAAAAPAGPWSQPVAPARSGGFLAGAAQTAMGVAGGVLLGNAISGLFGHGLGGFGRLGGLGGERIVEEPTVINEDVFVNDNRQDDSQADDRQAALDQSADDDTSGGGIFDSFFGGSDDQSA